MIYYDIGNDFLKEFPNTIFKILPLEMVALILKKKNELNFNVRFKNHLTSKTKKYLERHFVGNDRLSVWFKTTDRTIGSFIFHDPDRRNGIVFIDRLNAYEKELFLSIA